MQHTHVQKLIVMSLSVICRTEGYCGWFGDLDLQWSQVYMYIYNSYFKGAMNIAYFLHKRGPKSLLDCRCFD